VFGAYVTAGMDGVKRSLDPGDPFRGNLYDLSLEEIQSKGIGILPQNLNEAIENLERDTVVSGSLGVIYDEFISLKQAEWADYHKTVSKWEVDRYLTMF
jgi:glutamine synthetase